MGAPEPRPGSARWRAMFFFFSNRLGCAGSLLISAALTLLLLVLFGWIQF